jgi:hypothetical protein
MMDAKNYTYSGYNLDDNYTVIKIEEGSPAEIAREASLLPTQKQKDKENVPKLGKPENLWWTVMVKKLPYS